MNAKAQQIVSDLHRRGFQITFQPNKRWVLADRDGWQIAIEKDSGIQTCVGMTQQHERDNLLIELAQLIDAKEWEEAQALVEQECDWVDVHTQYNPSPSGDWRKTVTTSNRYYLFEDVLGYVYLMGHEERISAYGSGDRVTFEFDLINE